MTGTSGRKHRFRPLVMCGKLGIMMVRTLIVGYGNVDRGDDGVAYHIVNALRQQLGQSALEPDEPGLDGLGGRIDSVFMTQLVPELVETLTAYEQVVFVDAHTMDAADDVWCVAVTPQYKHSSFTHHMSPEILLALLEALYHKRLKGYMVSVRGSDFDFGRGLSSETAALVQPAVACILRLIGLDERDTAATQP